MSFTSHKDRNDFMQDDKQRLENTFHFASLKKYRFNLDMRKAMKRISLLLLHTRLTETPEENASEKKTF